MNNGRKFTESRGGELNILPLFTLTEKNDCFSTYTRSNLNDTLPQHLQKKTKESRFNGHLKMRVYPDHYVLFSLDHRALTTL